MVKIQDISPTKIINKTSEELKKIKEITPPDWAKYTKTGRAKERPPVQKDWWHKRTASILYKVNKLGPIGVNKLKVKYSSKKNRGHKPEKTYKASGNIIRKILQQLEKAELIKKAQKGTIKGKITTKKGIALLSK